MKIHVGLSLAAVALAGSAHALFVNGDFESGDFTGWTLGLTSGGAQTFQQVVDFDIDGPGALGTTKVGQFSAGRAAGVTTGDHGVTVTQMLNLTAGVEYTFQFDWAAHRTPGLGSNTQGGIFALMVNGAEVNRSAAGPTSAAVPVFGHHTGVFTPTVSGNHEVGVWIMRPFTIPANNTLFQAVDNFSATAVPEPATMVALGLGAAAFLRRRKK